MTRRIERWAAVVWSVAVLCVCYLGSGEKPLLERTRALGYLALVALCAALSVTPLARVGSALGRRLPYRSRVRRVLGLAACGGAIVHAMSALLGWAGPLAAVWRVPSLRAGLLTLTILLLLGASSFPALVRRLGLQHWSELHRLAYVALPSALWHALLQPSAAVRALLAIALSAGLLLAARLFPGEPRASEE